MRTFAIYMGLALILAAGVILYFVRHNVETSSRQKVADHARLAAAVIIPRAMPEDAWKKPLTFDEVVGLGKYTTSSLLANGTRRAKLISNDGTVIFSTESDATGTKTDPALMKEPLAGATTTRVNQLSGPKSEGGGQKVIEAYVPVIYPGRDKPAGVIVLITDYDTVAGSVRQQALPIAGFVLLVFLLLYLALLPVLRRTTNQLSFNNDELRRRASDLNENLIQRAAIEQRLRDTIEDLERSENALEHSQEETIMRLSMAVETRDQETGDHIERMGRYCALLAQKLGWNQERCELLRIAAPLHDVGKIAIPDSILLKPGELTPPERAEIEKHAEIGHEILSGSDSPLLDLAARIALSHHEHWDGNGYPNGLIGEEIPVEGRMAAIADVFDALTSDRVYRPAMPVERALSIMSEGRGAHFDPNLLDAFFDSIVEVLLIRDGHVAEKSKRQRENLGERRRQRRAQLVATETEQVDEDGEQRASLVV